MSDTRTMLYEKIKSVENELADLYEKWEKYNENPDEFDEDPVSEYVFGGTILGMGRYQEYLNDGYETLYYTLYRMVGGPNIVIRTDGFIEGSWGDVEVRAHINNEKARKVLGIIHELLVEVDSSVC